MCVASTPAAIAELSAAWEGERMPDGGARVVDAVLARLASATTEQAGGVLRDRGYHSQFVREAARRRHEGGRA